MTDGARSPAAPWMRVAASPWPWLLYLPGVIAPWLWARPSPEQAIAVAAGVATFLPLYILGSKGSDTRKRLAAVAILLISIGLAPTGVIWTIVSIYAVSLVAGARPVSQALTLALCFVAAAVAVGVLSRQHLFYWAPGVFMMAMVAIANMSNAALQDKNRALLDAQDAVRGLAETAERERIGRDLHDLLGRTLTLVAIKAELAARLVSIDPPRASREMLEVASAARGALGEVRAAVTGMTAHLAREVQASRTVCNAAGIDFIVEGQPETVGQSAGAVLAMALREAVTNVVRHSRAKRCHVTIDNAPDGVRLTVADDGKGGAIHEGGGIQGLRSRVTAGGGALALTSSDEGTRLTVSMPVEAAA